jgi:hypothetical protein
MSADAQEGERLGVGGLPIHGGLTPVEATRSALKAEDEAFEIARRAVLYQELPPKPPSEIELLRREVREMQRRLDLAAEVLRGEHDCGGWDE